MEIKTFWAQQERGVDLAFVLQVFENGQIINERIYATVKYKDGKQIVRFSPDGQPYEYSDVAAAQQFVEGAFDLEKRHTLKTIGSKF